MPDQSHGLVYWDTFGVFGGVGLGTRFLLDAFVRCGVKITLAAERRILKSFEADNNCASGKVNCISLTPPKYSLPWIQSRICNRYGVPLELDPRSDLGFDILRQKGLLAKEYKQRSNLLINFPQILPPTLEKDTYSVLVHDLNWRRYPENFPHPQKTDQWCKSWVEKARFVFTNSEFTRSEILAEYAVSADRVVSAPFAECPSRDAEPADFSILDRLKIVADEFYLYPASVGVHKGHDFLLSELSKAANRFPVVLVGPHTDGITLPAVPGQRDYFLGIAPGLESLSQQRRIRRAGTVSDSEMRILQHTCRAFLLPSRYEGFGFPLLEAMHNNKPVICSAIPAYLELLVRYAGRISNRLFDLNEQGSLAEILTLDSQGKLVFEPFPKDSSTNSGWTWDNSASRIIEAIVS